LFAEADAGLRPSGVPGAVEVIREFVVGDRARLW
jgi:hypothetical protein